MATCTAAGGGHHHHLRQAPLHFPSSCPYLLSGLSSPAQPQRSDFRVLLDTGPGGVPSSLEVRVPGCHLRLDPKELNWVLLRKF